MHPSVSFRTLFAYAARLLLGPRDERPLLWLDIAARVEDLKAGLPFFLLWVHAALKSHMHTSLQIVERISTSPTYETEHTNDQMFFQYLCKYMYNFTYTNSKTT